MNADRTHSVVDEPFRKQLARALFLGSMAGLLDSTLVLTSGFISPWAIAFNFGLLVAVFCAAAGFSVLCRRWLGILWLSADSVLLVVGILVFALRGCLFSCGDESLWRVAFPVGLAAACLVVTRWVQRRRPYAGQLTFIVIATAATTLCALDFAARDASLAPGLGIPLLVSAVVLGAIGSTVSKSLRRTIAWTLVAAACCSAWSLRNETRVGAPPRIASISSKPREGQAKDRPNVLLMVMDAVRADHLSLYGYARRTSLHLDALAKTSLVFDRAIAAGNYSLPSHASLLTGVLPTEHGARPRSGDGLTFRGLRSVDSALSSQTMTLAERLQGVGFATGGLSGNSAYLAAWTGLQRGFDAFDDRPKRVIGYHPFSFPVERRLGLAGPLMQELEEWEGKVISQSALSFATGSTPFFLFLNYFDAHAPYLPREGYSFEGDGLGTDIRPIPAYDSEIAYVDSAIGELLDGLERNGKLDNTIVIVTADHGDFFGEKGGFRGHGKGAYEEVLHVPLLVRFPSRLAVGRIARPFGLYEVPRLVLDLVQGQSIDWLYSESTEPRVLSQVWGRVRKADTEHAATLEPDANIVYFGVYKLIARSAGQDELYNLDADPREETNLLVGGDLEAHVLREKMLMAVKKLAPARPGVMPNLTTADFERLRGLGYITLTKPKPPRR